MAGNDRSRESGRRRALLLPVVLTLAPAAAAALLVTQQTMASMWDHGHDWWRIFAWQLYGWGFWALAAPLLLASGRRMFRSRPWWGYLPRSAALGVSASWAPQEWSIAHRDPDRSNRR